MVRMHLAYAPGTHCISKTCLIEGGMFLAPDKVISFEGRALPWTDAVAGLVACRIPGKKLWDFC